MYLSELKTRFYDYYGNEEEIQSPSNYYDATSPSAYEGEREPTFFQGSEDVPIVPDDGYYEVAEENRYKKIQALHGTGWQGPIEFDDDSL
jgi:hypothetical protein